MGRRTEYTEEAATVICDLLAEGQSLRSICIMEDMPAQSTVFKWLIQQPSFAEQYARAREAQADTLSDEILDIADDGSNDWMVRKNEDGSTDEVLNHEHVQRSRLRIDARKWYASKLAPKKYGDKQLVGSDPENPLPTPVGIDLSKLSEAALREIAGASDKPVKS